MRFNDHSKLAGQHAFLSASKYHWLRYDLEKLEATYLKAMTAQRGTELHELAHDLIRLGVKLPRTAKTLNMYVNDCIGFRMTPEVVLFVSPNAFGTTDAISFRRNKLMIFDLKNGVTPTHHDQLKVYAAFFCIEYGVKPFDIEIELRIYQNDEIRVCIPEADEITHIMDLIRTYDRRINELREEALN